MAALSVLAGMVTVYWRVMLLRRIRWYLRWRSTRITRLYTPYVVTLLTTLLLMLLPLAVTLAAAQLAFTADERELFCERALRYRCYHSCAWLMVRMYGRYTTELLFELPTAVMIRR